MESQKRDTIAFFRMVCIHMKGLKICYEYS